MTSDETKTKALIRQPTTDKRLLTTVQKPWREFEEGEVEAAKELYLKHGPYNLGSVIRGMRERGFAAFEPRDLKGDRKRGFAGLVAIYRWEKEWREALQVPGLPESFQVPALPELGVPEFGIPDSIELCNSVDSVNSGTIPDSGTPNSENSVNFSSWLAAGKPDWTWNWRYQRLIYRELDRLTSGDASRLMIFMPPRHGKSELVTVRYAAWRLIREPRLRIVVGSYAQKLARRFSRCIRAIYLGGPGVELADIPDEPRDLVVAGQDEWETPEGGGVKAVGAGTGVTGFGADLLILDDPIHGRAAAESKNNRERVWDWFNDDLMTRLEPKGQVILIQTRWHEDDLAGRLLGRQAVQGPKSKVQGREEKNVQGPKSKVQGQGRKKVEDTEVPGPKTLDFRPWTLDSARPWTLDSTTTSERWRVVSLPALAEEGDPLKRKVGAALCHARFPVRALLGKKADMGSYSFEALYQQRPVPSEGALFKREWFTRVVVTPPPGLRWCRGYDLAVSTRTSADYTASFRVALDAKTGDLYIADGFRGRIEFPEQRRYIVGRIRAEPDTEHGIEEALHGQAFVQELWREEKLSSAAFRGIRVTADKYTRALAWANRAEAGRVVLVRGPWIDDFLNEACRFPNATHDDQVDAVSLAVQMLEKKKNRIWFFK